MDKLPAFMNNKYFIIAVIIILFVILYLYLHRTRCTVMEGMRNIEIIDDRYNPPIVNQLDETPKQPVVIKPIRRRRRERCRVCICPRDIFADDDKAEPEEEVETIRIT